MRIWGTLRLAVACVLALSSLFFIAPLPATFADSPCYTVVGTTLTSGASCPGNLDLTGQGITAIAAGAFANDAALETVTAPNVTTIGDNAFYADTALTSISLQRATSIGDSAFAFVNTSLLPVRTISMPDVQSIGNDAFQYDDFSSLNLPESLTSIGSNAFDGTSSIAPIDLVLPDSLVTIGHAAFQQSTAFASFSVGPNITSLPGQTFYNNFGYGPTSITFRDASKLATLGNGDFFGFQGTSITLPNSLVDFGDQTFAEAYNLRYLNIPNTVTTMGSDDFIRDADDLAQESLQFISYCGSSNSVKNYAGYPPGTYQGCSRGVIFDPNGGSGVMSVETETVGSISPKALTANSFTWPGYSFDGWNTAPDGSGTAYADGANYPFTSTVLLYAQWKVLAAPLPVPDPVQSDAISGISPAQFTVGVSASVVISGQLNRKIVAIDVGSRRLIPDSFTQSPTSVSFMLTPLSSGAMEIVLYNGAVPVLSQMITVAPAPVVVPTPTPTVKAIAKCVSSKRTYIPLAKECLTGFTPVYK